MARIVRLSCGPRIQRDGSISPARRKGDLLLRRTRGRVAECRVDRHFPRTVIKRAYRHSMATGDGFEFLRQSRGRIRHDESARADSGPIRHERFEYLQEFVQKRRRHSLDAIEIDGDRVGIGCPGGAVLGTQHRDDRALQHACRFPAYQDSIIQMVSNAEGCHLQTGMESDASVPGNNRVRLAEISKRSVISSDPSPECNSKEQPGRRTSSLTPYKPIPRCGSPVPLTRSRTANSSASQS